MVQSSLVASARYRRPYSYHLLLWCSKKLLIFSWVFLFSASFYMHLWAISPLQQSVLVFRSYQLQMLHTRSSLFFSPRLNYCSLHHFLCFNFWLRFFYRWTNRKQCYCHNLSNYTSALSLSPAYKIQVAFFWGWRSSSVNRSSCLLRSVPGRLSGRS